MTTISTTLATLDGFTWSSVVDFFLFLFYLSISFLLSSNFCEVTNLRLFFLIGNSQFIKINKQVR